MAEEESAESLLVGHCVLRVSNDAHLGALRVFVAAS